MVGSLGSIISGSRKIVPANGGAAEIDKQLKTRYSRIWVGCFNLYLFKTENEFRQNLFIVDRKFNRSYTKQGRGLIGNSIVPVGVEKQIRTLSAVIWSRLVGMPRFLSSPENYDLHQDV